MEVERGGVEGCSGVRRGHLGVILTPHEAGGVPAVGGAG